MHKKILFRTAHFEYVNRLCKSNYETVLNFICVFGSREHIYYAVTLYLSYFLSLIYLTNSEVSIGDSWVGGVAWMAGYKF